MHQIVQSSSVARNSRTTHACVKIATAWHRRQYPHISTGNRLDLNVTADWCKVIWLYRAAICPSRKVARLRCQQHRRSERVRVSMAAKHTQSYRLDQPVGTLFSRLEAGTHYLHSPPGGECEQRRAGRRAKLLQPPPMSDRMHQQRGLAKIREHVRWVPEYNPSVAERRREARCSGSLTASLRGFGTACGSSSGGRKGVKLAHPACCRHARTRARAKARPFTLDE